MNTHNQTIRIVELNEFEDLNIKETTPTLKDNLSEIRESLSNLFSGGLFDTFFIHTNKFYKEDKMEEHSQDNLVLAEQTEDIRQEKDFDLLESCKIPGLNF